MTEKKQEKHPRTIGQWQKYNIRIMGIPEGEEKGTEEMFEAIMTDNAPKINVRFQTTDPGIQRTQAAIEPQKFQLGMSYINQKIKHTDNNLERSQREKKTGLSVEEKE